VAGWTFSNTNVAKIEILVDGVLDGKTSYGSPRPDVASVYPNAPYNIGFSYSLITSNYRNGPHILNVRVTDTSGNVAVFPGSECDNFKLETGGHGKLRQGTLLDAERHANPSSREYRSFLQMFRSDPGDRTR
jgi:hypothetical protein